MFPTRDYPFLSRRLIKRKGILFTLIMFTAGIIQAQITNLYFENYTIDNGLSNNMVHRIFQDSRGWMWFGTSQGLNRFDGYKFTVFRNDMSDSTSLLSNLIRTIYEDMRGNLWIGTETGGLHLFNREKENFRHYTQKNLLSNNSVNAIAEDKAGNLWIGTENGLNRMDRSKHTFISYLHSDASSNTLCDNLIRVLHTSKDGKLWIGTSNGLDAFDPLANRFEHYRLPEVNPADNEIWEIFEDSDAKLWIGTYTGGIVILDPQTKQMQLLKPDPGNNRSLTVRSILKDKQGYYWIGSRAGLYIYSKESGTFTHFEKDERESSASLCHNSILHLFEDAKKDIWVGTRGGISYLNSEKQNFRNFRALPQDNRYLNNSEVYAFWIDPEKNIWVGTENGGINILNHRTGRFRYITRNSAKNPLSDNCIKAMTEDHKGNLWIGTYMGGINIYHLKTGKITYFEHRQSNPSGLIDNRVWSIFCDGGGKIWIGTDHGIDLYNDSLQQFTHFQHITDKQVNWISEDPWHQLWIGARDEIIIFDRKTNKISRSQVNTRGLCVDSRKRIWLTTTGKGLARYEMGKGIVKFYTEKDGLANDITFSIAEDKQGLLWISTAKGLSKFDPATGIFKNYFKEDGLQINQFNYGAFYKSGNGELLFGGSNGFTIFDPGKVTGNPYIPPVFFTDFKIFNHSVPVSDEKGSILNKSISEVKEIVLPYNQNVLTFEFAALNYACSNNNKYAFILKGFEKKWNNSGSLRSVTYTNLNPGNYVLQVKGANNDNVWNQRSTELLIRVLPPWWRTWWFKTFIFAGFVSIIYFLILFFTARAKLKHELLFERERAQKLHELDMMKLKFFTNISHEIRTPLTLITGPVEKIIHGNLTPELNRNYLMIVQRNALQLLKLINQLLDFRKLESGNLKLELKQGNLVQFVYDTVSAFHQLAADKGIKLNTTSTGSEIPVRFDPDKLEKIINNLLSNAVKFTAKEGTITVNITFVPEHSGKMYATVSNWAEISVTDTGVGIHESNLEKIFLRFFQVPGTKNDSGTGIGLALTKELVKLHHGEIAVESNPGNGTKFTVRLPCNAPFYESTETGQPTKKAETQSGTEDESSAPEKGATCKILLIAEDNKDVIFFIRTHFESDYRILEANNGNESWNLTLRELPDIIISDIMMPEMDGIELCRKIKKDERTSHIPVILLTALSSRDHKINGLDAGADDYVTKPFDIEELRLKVNNLYSLKSSLCEKYRGELLLKPKNIVITSPDEKFLLKAVEVTEKNISNCDFGIGQFASEMGVSRVQLYRKIESLTRMTVKEFIKNIRLKRAAQLLTQHKQWNISEIAYHVGFNDLSHFRKCFREEFGMNASAYGKKHND